MTNNTPASNSEAQRQMLLELLSHENAEVAQAAADILNILFPRTTYVGITGSHKGSFIQSILRQEMSLVRNPRQ